MRVALIKTGALGDVVRTTAILPGLFRLDPEMELTWITAPGALELVHGLRGVAEAVRLDDPADAPWRSRAYDWVISLDDGRDECELASSLESPKISGGFLGPDGNRLYTEDVEPWFGMGILRPASRGGLEAANALKKVNTKTVAALLYQCLGLPGPVGRTSLPVGEAHREVASSWAASRGWDAETPLVGMNTGAGGRWRFKSWGQDQTALLARRLHDERGVRVVILGGEAEADRNSSIVTEADRPGAIVAGPSGLSILEFAALIERCSLLVTSDSLALHLAVAVDRPTISFYGPTSADEIETYGKGEKVVTPLGCRCCYLKDCEVRPHCMQSIDVETLATAVAGWLPPVAIA